ncbi:MAG: SGNH/GDSL hydrolase family protein [Notoacmeibacter sp.]|nr:SGNH/GDSL hydrolase family protein [Notoacmeibacter sp.]
MKRRYPSWAAAATWLAWPVYAWQGVGVRLRTERLVPAAGPVSGEIAGEGDPFRLLVIGDSSVAGVGVDHTSQGLAWRLAEALATATGRPVRWRAAGSNSATSAQVRDHVVPHVAERDWTHVVLSIGTNDMKNFHSLSRFKREFGTLIYALRARFPAARIIWSPMLPMTAVPAMPRALGRILDIRADAINARAVRLLTERGAEAASPMPEVAPQGFSRDGFHASASGYAYWAEHMAGHIGKG